MQINRKEIQMEKNYEDIIDIAKKIGNLRFQLIELIQKEHLRENKYNKKDQTFLHSIEFNDDMSDEELLKLIRAEKESRNDRRNVKNRRILIQSLLDGILIKSPLVFINKVIENGEPFDKTIEELKSDEKIWNKEVK